MIHLGIGLGSGGERETESRVHNDEVKVYNRKKIPTIKIKNVPITLDDSRLEGLR